jgi:hypothetical protein
MQSGESNDRGGAEGSVNGCVSVLAVAVVADYKPTN